MYRLVLLIALSLFMPTVVAGGNVCNYFFVYIYNQYGSTINYSIESSQSGSLYGPTPSGTIDNGQNVMLYFGNENSGKEVYTGGKITITASNGSQIGQITASGSDAVPDEQCAFTTFMTIDSGYKACGVPSNDKAPQCSECLTNEAEASAVGEGNDSTSAGSPSVGYTICNNS